MTIVVGCTLPVFKMHGDPMNWGAWLINAEAVKASVDDDVRYMCAIETDARGLTPFEPLLRRLDEIDGDYWTFQVDERAEVRTTANRLQHIVTGHNMVGYYGIENGASHVLFLASDTQCRDDVLPRLLELDVAAAACHITTYCLDGPKAKTLARWHSADCRRNEHEYRQLDDGSVEITKVGCTCGADSWDVRLHMETCACMLLRRDVVRRIKWRYDPDAGTTDDPSIHADLRDFLGEQVYSRHDVLATHWPESIPSIEDRHSEEERRVYR